MERKHICILTHAHLCRNPRVVKEANLLHKLGYRVTVLSCLFDQKLISIDWALLHGDIKIKHYANLSTQSLQAYFYKLQRKLATLMLKKFNFTAGESIGYGYQNLMTAALKEDAYLYICHQEMPTVVGMELIKKGKQVAFDLEDWYSEDLLPGARQERAIELLRKAETYALQHGAFCITTSNAMANVMANKLNKAAPNVIRNTFENVIEQASPISLKPSLAWFSQTIGPGRGLELLMEALKLVKKPIQLHLRGVVNSNYQALLTNLLNNTVHDIYFHPLVSPDILPKELNQHDIGLALELDSPLSRDLTITNKIFQYLQSGLAVIASATQGQKELATLAPTAVKLFAQNDASGLAEHINFFLDAPTELTIAKKEALQTFKMIFCWEIEQLKYQAILKEVLAS